MSKIRFVGLDVHADTVTVAVAEPDGEVRSLGHINRVNMMGELAASIAHEVNQPLTGIVSNGSACLRFLAGAAPDVEEAREAVSDIVRDGKRAGEVIARIRALTGRRPPKKSWT
jgi:C4-dicarboxylate-specific signal transduction histidine kinase